MAIVCFYSKFIYLCDCPQVFAAYVSRLKFMCHIKILTPEVCLLGIILYAERLVQRMGSKDAMSGKVENRIRAASSTA